MKEKYEVFISSTHDDLVEERNKIKDVLLSMGCIPRYMESFYASDISTWNFIKDILSGCDYYIIILAGRYGSICDEVGKSFTQMEYEYAEQLGIPISRFLYIDPKILPFYKHDKERACQKNYTEFREMLQRGKIVKYWSNPDELACSVAVSIHNYIKTDILNQFKDHEFNTNRENDVFANLKKIESIIKEISNYNIFHNNDRKYEENQIVSFKDDSPASYKLSNSLEFNHLFDDTLKEFSNIVLTGGFNSLSYFFDIKINLSTVKLHYFKEEKSLKKFIFKENQIILNIAFKGYISGNIIIKFDKYYKARIFNMITRIYSTSITEHDKTLYNSFFQELISIFTGAVMTNIVGFFNSKEPFHKMHMTTNFNHMLNCEKVYVFELSSNKHNFVEFESLLLLGKKDVLNLWRVIKSCYLNNIYI